MHFFLRNEGRATGQVLHGSATTTAAIRRAIHHNQESLRALAKRYGIKQKTVAEWKQRASVKDPPIGPREPKSTVLTTEQKGLVVASRRQTLLPLDDCLYALQPTISQLSARCCIATASPDELVSREGKARKQKPKACLISFVYINITAVQTAKGKLHSHIAVDCISQFAFVKLVEKANRVTASAFLQALVAAVQYKIHTLLTDNGIQLRLPARYADGPTARFITPKFDMRCREKGTERLCTKVNHPWTSRQVEHINRTIKQATVQRYHHDDHAQPSRHLDDSVRVYNFGRRLKTLKGLTPYEAICNTWTKELD